MVNKKKILRVVSIKEHFKGNPQRHKRKKNIL